MQLNRCPVCHNRIGLESLVQDEAGRELLVLLAGLGTGTGAALVSYLGLFRSASRDLPNERALRLAREVLELGEVGDRSLQIALSQTVESLRAKPTRTPLKNHNYFKQVLESVQAALPPEPRVRYGAVSVEISPESKPAPPQSKTGQACLALERLKRQAP